MGIAICAVFIFQEHHPVNQPDWRYSKITHELVCSIRANEYECTILNFPLSDEFCKIKLHHLWLQYFPSLFFNMGWKQALNQVDANGFSQIEIIFETDGLGLEVTKCGAHLVFEQDVEDLKQNMVRPSSCRITPYEDDLEDSTKNTKIKRSHDDFGGNEAGPSGEGTSNSNDVNIPQPKRIRLSNLIERFIPSVGNLFGNLSTQLQENSDCEEEESL